MSPPAVVNGSTPVPTQSPTFEGGGRYIPMPPWSVAVVALSMGSALLSVLFCLYMLDCFGPRRHARVKAVR